MSNEPVPPEPEPQPEPLPQIIAGASISTITATVAPTAKKTKFTIAASSASGVRLYGKTSVWVKDGNIAFKRLKIHQAGEHTLTILDETQAVVFETTVVISAGKARTLAFSQPPTDVPAGGAFTVAVCAFDRYRNLVSADGADVTLTLHSENQVSSLLSSRTASPVDGVATFAGLSISEPGSFRLVARESGTFSRIRSERFTVA